jgi:hypothetical protein
VRHIFLLSFNFFLNVQMSAALYRQLVIGHLEGGDEVSHPKLVPGIVDVNVHLVVRGDDKIVFEAHSLKTLH